MSYIIDRRLNAKKKSTVNRQRFLRRYKKHIKRAVEEAVNNRSIRDIDQGGEVSIPSKDITEPIFHHGNGGIRQRVFPGNKEFVVGDEIKRPEGGGGGGSGQGQASNQGEGEDEFTFQINQEEFLDFMFEDLELPNMIKKQLRDATSFEVRRAGFTSVGSPDKLNVVRSLRAANARRIALSGKERRKIRELKAEIKTLEGLLPNQDAVLQIAALNDGVLNREIRPAADAENSKFVSRGLIPFNGAIDDRQRIPAIRPNHRQPVRRIATNRLQYIRRENAGRKKWRHKQCPPHFLHD
ncbi:DUF444 family protein [uncultured Amphritea sp.]|uniref:DUF444 family protein n=1 Tax=uncultured Amphritea sp. TaxID=981605 RepID=UPI002624E3DE|nr:DUF444 family protein [uncultured Amphritea sp.]